MPQPPEAGERQQQLPQQQLPLVRSLVSRLRVRVLFFNRSPRTIQLLWINFQGQPESYGKVQPQTGKRIITYALGMQDKIPGAELREPLRECRRHPWMFRDAETDDPMMVNDKEMYLPKVLENGQESVVSIMLPVFSLRERCLQAVRKLVRIEDFPRLEIALSLQEDLARKPSVHSDLRRISRKVEQRLLQNREEQREENT